MPAPAERLSMARIDADVIVIGAGAAGLAAAATLLRAGKSVLLLEARDRIGGRIWTRREPHLGCPIELGAEFIHGTAPLTRALLAQAGVATIEATQQRWVLRAGELTRGDDWFSRVMQSVGRSDALLREDLSFDDFIERQPTLTAEERESARRMAQGFDAADTARASARAIVSEWTGDALGDAPQSRPEGGYEALLVILLAQIDSPRLRLRLQSRVERVQWSPGAVTVSGRFLTQPFELSAPRVIVTLPLAILQQPGRDGVVFAPELTAKRAALAGLATGSVVKVLLRFATPFWETVRGGRYRDASFLSAPGTEFPTLWTAAPLRAPLLVAWRGGPEASRLAAGSGAALVPPILDALRSMFGPEPDIPGLLQAYYYHDWQHDPYARGAYSYVLTGGSDARRALAQPLADTLFFAGEATDMQDESGTVAGALESGSRAAREALGSAVAAPLQP